MEKIIVIGGGASGLLAAIYAAKNKKKVTLIERNSSCAKKILITGNGKCNYFNIDQDIRHYHTNNRDSLSKIVTEKNQQEILTFFDEIGIVPKIKNGYYYPYSGQATSIKEMLLLTAKLLHVDIIYDLLIEEIIQNDSTFILNPNQEKIKADKVILAMGSKACPKTGSDGIGYQIASSLGHSVVEIRPALVPLIGSETYFKLWAGIRCDVRISLYENEQKIKEEEGEIQLTDYGMSGICCFNVSGAISKGLSQAKTMTIKIDFLPWLKVYSVHERMEWLKKRNQNVEGYTIEQLLEGFLHYKLIAVLLKLCHIPGAKYWDDLIIEEQELLTEKLSFFEVEIKGTHSFDKAQVCTGGISLDEVFPQTMESTKVKGLYLTGELLDVDGDCGGYNLSFAWISGMLAGRSVGGVK